MPEGMVEEYFPVEVAKASTSKNDIPNKFWLSVEPYCAPFTEDDLKVVIHSSLFIHLLIVVSAVR